MSALIVRSVSIGLATGVLLLLLLLWLWLLAAELEQMFVLVQNAWAELNVTFKYGGHVAERELEQELARFVAELPLGQLGQLDPARDALVERGVAFVGFCGFVRLVGVQGDG